MEFTKSITSTETVQYGNSEILLNQRSKLKMNIQIGFFRKINIFWGMKILWIFFGVITKFDYIKGSFLCILGSIPQVKVQNWDIFMGR